MHHRSSPITAFIYTSADEHGLIQVEQSLFADFPSDLRAIELHFFAGREAGVSHHVPVSSNNVPHSDFSYIAVWDIRLQRGFPGELRSNYVVFKRSSFSDSDFLAPVDDTDVTRILNIIHELRYDTDCNAAPDYSQLTARTVQALFIEKYAHSGFQPCRIVEQPGENFLITNISTFFTLSFEIERRVITIANLESSFRVLCMYEAVVAADPDNCGYLFLLMENDYSLRDFTLNEAPLAAQALQMIINDN